MNKFIQTLILVAIASVLSAATSYQTAQTANNVIKNETVAAANTASRIGTAFNNVLDAAVLEISEQSSAFTAAAGYQYSVDTSSAAVTVTAPSSPVSGDIFEVLDKNGTWATYACTVNFGNYPLHAYSTPNNLYVGDGNYAHRRFRFDGTRWLITQ